MGLLMRSPPVDLSSESIYYLRSRRSQAAVGNARSTSLVVLVKSASMVPRPEARCPAGALFTRVPRRGILRSSLLASFLDQGPICALDAPRPVLEGTQDLPRSGEWTTSGTAPEPKIR